MGVLSDIIIADRKDAASFNAAGGAHLEQWDGLESKGIDTIKLGALSQILHNRPLDDINAVATFMMNAVVDQASDDGPWVYLVPEELQLALAALDERRQQAAAEKWATTEEFALDGWLQEDVEEYFEDLVACARKARDLGKSLLLWMAL